MPTNTNPLWAAHFADVADAVSAPIRENRLIAKETYQIRLECPDIAQRIRPGQFVMLRLPTRDDPLLGRPFALYDSVMDASGKHVGIDVVYLVVGAMTGQLANCVAGETLEVIGPLGNGFLAPGGGHLVMVAGGIGQTPFLALAKEHLGIKRYGNSVRPSAAGNRLGRPKSSPDDKTPTLGPPTATLCYGAKSGAYLAGIGDFESIGVDVRTSTDDGSAGHHGLVTELLEQLLVEPVPQTESTRSHHTPCDEAVPEANSPINPPADQRARSEGEGRGADKIARIVACGPEPMMETVARIASESELPCDVSLETPMACGLGICFSCVARIRQPDGRWDYKRTCVDGPVFDAQKIVW